MTDSQRCEVTRRYEAGESSTALAVEFHVDRRTGTRVVRAAGAKVRYRVVDNVDVDEARRLYESRLSLVAVGDRLGISARSVLTVLRLGGIRTRPVGTNQWR